MKPWKSLTKLLLFTLLALSASGVVSAKVASGLQNLGGEVYQGQSVVNPLTHRAKIDFSTTPAPGSPVVPKGPLARGRAAEQRVLDDLGLSKNTQKVRTGEGASIPDALTKRQSIEIKDCIGVSCTKQIRIQTEAARNSGRQSTLITGDKTHISGPAQRAFDNIIRRPDLGPQ